MLQYSPRRKAILIGSPGNEDNFLSGVGHDLKNFSKFLTSDKGGGWYEEEIHLLENPSVAEVRQIIKESIVDYLIVFYTGHGYTEVGTRKRILCLKDQDISDASLINRSSKQLILVDACRTYSDVSISGLPDFGQDLLSFEGSPVRDTFDRYIANSPAGKVIIHSTQAGQISVDTPKGGLFTSALLFVATQINTRSDYKFVSLKKILEHVPRVMQEISNTQNPSVVFVSGQMKIPFAVGIPQIETELADSYMPIRKQQSGSSSNGGVWLAFGLLILGILVSKGK